MFRSEFQAQTQTDRFFALQDSLWAATWILQSEPHRFMPLAAISRVVWRFDHHHLTQQQLNYRSHLAALVPYFIGWSRRIVSERSLCCRRSPSGRLAAFVGFSLRSNADTLRAVLLNKSAKLLLGIRGWDKSYRTKSQKVFRRIQDPRTPDAAQAWVCQTSSDYHLGSTRLRLFSKCSSGSERLRYHLWLAHRSQRLSQSLARNLVGCPYWVGQAPMLSSPQCWQRKKSSGRILL